jgi:hypothetical protein
MPEKKLRNNKIKYLVFLFPVIVLIYMSQQETAMCDQFKPYYYRKINGEVLKRYDCIVGGRKIGCIDLVDKYGKEYHFNWQHEWKVYDLIEQGDPVSKPTGTSNFEFYRKGELLGKMNWDCSPPS